MYNTSDLCSQKDHLLNQAEILASQHLRQQILQALQDDILLRLLGQVPQ